MKAIPVLLGLSVLTNVVLGVLVPWGPAPRQGLHVYVLSAPDDSRRDAQMEAVAAYMSRIGLERGFEMHFARARDVQDSVPPLLAQLAGSRRPDAEGPLFVRLDAPTSKSKKALRAAFDDVSALTGERRRQALRAVVPVLTLQHEAASADTCTQLGDDITYAEDNFGGVAFLLDEAGMGVLRNCPRPPL